MPEPTTAARPTMWSRTLPATAPQVREARRSLALLLNGCPASEDALLCLSEIVTNAIMHSRSGRPGGHLTIRVAHTPAWLRVEVQDEGGPWLPRSPGEDHGRGLAIVEALALRLHVSAPDADSPARTVAFEMSLQ